MANQLHLDFETRSEVDLPECGLDRYVRHPSTQILLMAYAFGEGRVHLWEPHKGQPMPADAREALEDPFVTKFAWSATFERLILKYVLDIDVPIHEWRDPMVNARHMSLPGYLGDVGKILHIKEDEAKLEEGKQLIKLFCEKAVEASDGGLFGAQPAAFRDWSTNPADWDLFCDYVKNDVKAERAIDKKLSRFPLPDSEQRLWTLDQAINARGMPINMRMVRGSQKIIDLEMTKLKARLKELTGLENPNSNDQMLAWVQKQGYPFGALGKPLVQRCFAGEGELTPLGREVLDIRAMTSKSAVHKFTAIADNVSEDGWIRHQFVFAGASRTSRWSGRDFQPQNVPRPTKEVEENMDRAIELLENADYDAIAREFSSPLDVVTSCTRAAIKAPEGSRLVVCDLAAIEARVLGWISGCEKINQVFRDGRDPYLSFGVFLYGETYEALEYEYKVLKKKTRRNNAKPGQLGCGYQLSGGEEVENDDGDIIKTGLWGYAAAMGVDLTREESHKSVSIFRKEFPEVVEMWSATEDAAIKAVRDHEDQQVGPVTFHAVGSKMLQVILPSGRPLNYVNPTLETVEMESKNGNKYKRTVLSYEGVNQKTRQWGPNGAYGGRWVENLCQSIARDILCHGMVRAAEIGLDIVLHVHDEIGCVVPNDSPLGLKDLEACMSETPSWAPGLLLGAEGYENSYYKKG